ncbi:hypothetical protein Bca101_020617 [Brassica carinata]
MWLLPKSILLICEKIVLHCMQTLQKEIQTYGDDSDDEDNGLHRNPRYNCLKHNDIEDVIYSLYLVLRISDESAAETKFLLFDETANELIVRPALALVEEAAEELPSFVPQSLTDLIGRKNLFKIKIDSENQKGSISPYVVDSVADDADMIEEFKELSMIKIILYYVSFIIIH